MTEEDRIVARVLRIVSQAIWNAYEPGYYGHGGPQDGDDEPPKFHAKQCYEDLFKQANDLDPSS